MRRGKIEHRYYRLQPLARRLVARTYCSHGGVEAEVPMTNFYRIKNNTFDSRGMPWIQSIVKGLVDQGECKSCGSRGTIPEGDQRVPLERNRARWWPDLFGCGACSYLVASKRFVDALRGCGVRVELGAQWCSTTTRTRGSSCSRRTCRPVHSLHGARVPVRARESAAQRCLHPGRVRFSKAAGEIMIRSLGTRRHRHWSGSFAPSGQV